MHIYNITFIVEKEIEKSWIEHIDMVLLPEISNNMPSNHRIQINPLFHLTQNQLTHRFFLFLKLRIS